MKHPVITEQAECKNFSLLKRSCNLLPQSIGLIPFTIKITKSSDKKQAEEASVFAVGKPQLDQLCCSRAEIS